ncbi:hypothetical protein AKN88_02860 [Thiopseudomonas alkaliphila]|uniref:DUF2069 domain-containing protein n=1 Tax=Thiopseudomonas alkaliphila TaxID=1697053 RepID=A0A0K1XC84_9GAMM|nr:DUF2069 domain-containing protein [Thiopseudomonas alkaliphila]AKX58995.1 hypothetical protein AKN88_02860 [Thiopseudomonas alkaliphila]
MAKAKKALPSLEWLQPRLKLSHRLSIFFVLGLVVLLAVWNLFYANLHGARTWVIMLIELVPLAIVLPGILLGNARAHAWMCFIVNLYFIKGVVATLDPSRFWLGMIEILLSVGLFVSAMLYTRWRFQYNRKLQGE